MPLLPTTRLEAVNAILASVGEAPVSSLANAQSADVAMIENLLNETLRFVCLQEWHFNSEYDYVFVPTTNGEILLPANCVYLDVNHPEQCSNDVIIRDQKLYDRKRKTYTFDTSIRGDVRWLMEFTELPQVARTYVIARASRVFADRVTNSQQTHSVLRQDEQTALAHLEQFEADTADSRLIDDPRWIRSTYDRML